METIITRAGDETGGNASKRSSQGRRNKKMPVQEQHFKMNFSII